MAARTKETPVTPAFVPAVAPATAAPALSLPDVSPAAAVEDVTPVAEATPSPTGASVIDSPKVLVTRLRVTRAFTAMDLGQLHRWKIGDVLQKADYSDKLWTDLLREHVDISVEVMK